MIGPFGAAVLSMPRPDRYRPLVAVLGAESSAVRWLRAACESQSRECVRFDDAFALIEATRNSSVSLIVVFAEELRCSPQELLRRRKPGVPTVLVGPPFGSDGHVLALGLGFDAVWPEGLSLEVLRALLQSTALPSSGTPTDETSSTLGPLSVDTGTATCLFDRRPVMLGTSQLKTLALLLARSPGVVSRDELRAAIPLSAVGPNSRVVDAHVSRLRQQLRNAAVDSIFIVGVRGRGYRAVLREPVKRRFVGVQATPRHVEGA